MTIEEDIHSQWKPFGSKYDADLSSHHFAYQIFERLPIGNECMVLRSVVMLAFCVVSALMAEDGQEIPPPKSTDAPTWVTIVKESGQRQTGMYDPQTRQITITIGNTKGSLSVDPAKVAHWYAAPVPAEKSANSPAKTSGDTTGKDSVASPGTGEAAAPATALTPAAKAKALMKDRLIRYLATWYAVDPATLQDLSVAKLTSLRTKLVEKANAEPIDDRKIRSGALNDLPPGCVLTNYSMARSRHQFYRSRGNSPLPCQPANDPGVDAALLQFDLDQFDLSLSTIPITTILKIGEHTKSLRDALKKTGPTPNPPEIPVEKVLLPAAPTEGKSDPKDPMKRATFSMRVTIPGGLLVSPTLAYRIRDQKNKPMTVGVEDAYEEIADENRDPLMTYWRWDSERYAGNPGKEFDEYLAGTYTAIWTASITEHRLKLPTPMTSMDRAILLKALFSPTNHFTAWFTKVNLDGTAWTLPDPTESGKP